MAGRKADKGVRVWCRDCANASDFIGNGCHCRARGARVCACDRYGRICDMHVPKGSVGSRVAIKTGK